MSDDVEFLESDDDARVHSFVKYIFRVTTLQRDALRREEEKRASRQSRSFRVARRRPSVGRTKKRYPEVCSQFLVD